MATLWRDERKPGTIAEFEISAERNAAMSNTPPLNEYATAEHALKYLAHADRIPHRAEGEAVLFDFISHDVERILDLGAGDGRLLALLKIDRPGVSAVALDFSPTMLDAARQRFRSDPTVEVLAHNLDDPLPALGIL